MEFVLALLPIMWLVIALAALGIPGHIACGTALVASCVLALAFWQLSAVCVATAALEGILNALWPICAVVVAALFLYNLCVKTGGMETVKRMLLGVSQDERVLALLIAWGFGNFMEGIAGFGTAVAVPAAMLVGIGFEPFTAVVGCLVVNATPTAFGSVGVPTATLATITGPDSVALSGDIALMEFAITFAAPYLLVAICGGGLRSLRGALGVTTLAAASFTVPWLLMALFAGPELPNIVGAVVSMVCIVLYARHASKSGAGAGQEAESAPDQAPAPGQALSLHEALRAWSPFILVFVLLMGTSKLCPPVHNVLALEESSVVVYAGESPNTLTMSWLSAPGLMILFAALLGGAIQGARPAEMFSVFCQTIRSYWRTLVTICSVLAMAKVMSYSGMIDDIAVVLVSSAGGLYPLVAPAVGALGGFVTGSGTSSNVLFGGLQAGTAQSLGLDATWIAAANAAGAGIGKMISPQSIAIGASAAGIAGSAPKILRAALKYFAVFIVLTCILCFAAAR